MTGFVLCAAFGLWFARQQMLLLKPDAAYPPLWLMFGTGLRVSLLAFIPFAWAHAYLNRKPLPPYSAVLALTGPLALLSVYAGVNISWALRLSLGVMLLATLFSFAWRNGTKKYVSDKHWIAFALILLVQIILNGYFSPLVIHDTPLHVPGMFVPQIAASSSLLRAFVWIKEFSLSSLTYFYWLITPNSSVNFESPVLQLLTLLFDSASSNIMDFYRLLHWIFFIACVGGSFGFYLLLKAGLQIRWSISVMGGILYIFVQNPFFDSVLNRDYIVAISTELSFPFALCAIFCALREKNLFLAALSGAALAFSCVLLAPHPELLFEMLYGFAIPALAFAYTAYHKNWKDPFLILLCSAASFIVLVLFHAGPPLLAQFTGELYTRGHSEQLFLPFNMRIKLDVHFFVILHLYVAIKSVQMIYRKTQQQDRRSQLTLPVTILVLIMLLAPIHSPLMVILSDLFHLPADMEARAYGRRGCFIAIFSLLLFAIAAEKADLPGMLSRGFQRQLNLREAFSARTGTVLLMLVTLIACWPLSFRPSDVVYNPQNCNYYIMMQALLANDALLKGDRANDELIRHRLADFEKDIYDRPAQSYEDNYSSLLKDAHVSSAAAIEGTGTLYDFARKAAPIIDSYYLDSHQNCVHPADGRYDDGRKLTLLPNIASLYSGLPTPFHLISAFTADQPLPHLFNPGQESAIMFGAGQGLFVQNGGTDFDARFMVGPPLLQALYLRPGLDYTDLGILDDNRNWWLEPALWKDVVYRKLFDIAGMDIILLPAQRAAEFSAMSGFSKLALDYPLPLRSFDEVTVMSNQQSYGMAYLADHVTSLPPHEIARLEEVIRRHLIKQESLSAFQDARDFLYAELQTLHGYRDILLEEQAPSQEEIPQGNVTIENILGEAAVMKADCKRETCELVYNNAALPGWYAYVDGMVTHISRANFAFMAIRVPRGIHEVWFVYAPVNFLCFTLVSLLGFILLPYWYATQGMKRQEQT